MSDLTIIEFERLVRESLWEAKQRGFSFRCRHTIANKQCCPFGALVMAQTGNWTEKNSDVMWDLFLQLESTIFGPLVIKTGAFWAGLRKSGYSIDFREINKNYYELGKRIAEDFNVKNET